ncbi:MAG: hypothetical protein AB8B53_06815 [Flavobacteriales bacterium]
MKIKIYLSLIALLISVLTASAQKIKLKDDKVYVDGSYLMDYESKLMLNEFYLLKEGEELVMVLWNDNGTREYKEDDFMTIHFLKEDIKVETHRTRMRKGIVKWLLSGDVLTSDGQVVKEKAELFYKKFDEKITERTIISR